MARLGRRPVDSLRHQHVWLDRDLNRYTVEVTVFGRGKGATDESRFVAVILCTHRDQQLGFRLQDCASKDLKRILSAEMISLGARALPPKKMNICSTTKSKMERVHSQT